MECVVISGGAGFVGSHLADAFLARGYRVVVVDNLLTGNIRNFSQPVDDTFLLLLQDCADPIVVDGPIHYVLHFASPASPIDYLKHPIETMMVGSCGTRNMLELARENNARFLMASTSEIYGDPMEHPQPESYSGNVNPIGPRSVYDEAKRFSESLTMAYHRTYGVNTGIVRIFNTYGPRMRLNDGRAIPNFVYQALVGDPVTVCGDGSMTRSFCYISDLVEGIRRLVISDIHEPVNIGYPDEYTILELAEKIIAATGSSSKIVYQPLMEDDPKLRCPDIRRAKTLLGWEPTIGLEEGLVLTIEAFRKELDSYVVRD